MIPSSLPSKAETAKLAANILLDIGAVHLNTDEPFTHSSGLRAPTYVDCRKIISFPRARSLLMDYLAATVMRDVGPEAFTNVAGGETAGIPFGAMVAERLALPMTYVRKKPKGYGRNSRIEGLMREGDRVLLVEDMATDGGSKVSFVQAIRDTGATCQHTAVIFYYDIFKDALAKLKAEDIQMHWLCTWWDILTEAEGRFPADTLAEVKLFLNDPTAWRAQRGFPTEV